MLSMGALELLKSRWFVDDPQIGAIGIPCALLSATSEALDEIFTSEWAEQKAHRNHPMMPWLCSRGIRPFASLFDLGLAFHRVSSDELRAEWLPRLRKSDQFPGAAREVTTYARLRFLGMAVNRSIEAGDPDLEVNLFGTKLMLEIKTLEECRAAKQATELSLEAVDKVEKARSKFDFNAGFTVEPNDLNKHPTEIDLQALEESFALLRNGATRVRGRQFGIRINEEQPANQFSLQGFAHDPYADYEKVWRKGVKPAAAQIGRRGCGFVVVYSRSLIETEWLGRLLTLRLGRSSNTYTHMLGVFLVSDIYPDLLAPRVAFVPNPIAECEERFVSAISIALERQRLW